MTQSYSEISFDSQSPPMSDIRSLVDSPEPDIAKMLGDFEKTDRPDRLDLRGDKLSDADGMNPPSYHKAIGYLQMEGGTVMQVFIYLFLIILFVIIFCNT